MNYANRFKQYLIKNKPNIIMCEQYKGSRTKIRVQCKTCKCVWKTTPDNIKHTKYTCPKCAKRIASHEEKVTLNNFLVRLKLKNKHLHYLTAYQCMSLPCDFYCDICNHQFSRVPTDLLNKRAKYGCPFCDKSDSIKKNRLTEAQFKSKLYAVNKTIINLDTYVKANLKIRFKCTVCGCIWKATPNNILRGKGCPKCNIKEMSRRKSLSPTRILERIHSYQPNINVITPISKTSQKVQCICEICGYKWKTSVQSLLAKHGCPKCAHIKACNKHRRSQKEINDILLEKKAIIYLNEETVMGDINKSNKYYFKCRECSYSWKSTLKYTLLHPTCPKCERSSTESQGEYEIKQFLKAHNIHFESPYIPGDSCRDKKPLHYDFKVGNILIEYQGSQHYYAKTSSNTTFKQAQHRLHIQQRHDYIKRKWASENNYTLYEILYKDSVYDKLKSIFERK